MSALPDILCIGSVLWDIIGRSPLSMRAGMDVPGRITRLPGGVALNIAVALAGLGLRPAVLTAIGRDAEGDELIAAIRTQGLIADFAFRPVDLPTDRYMAVEGANGLIAAVADAHSLEACGDRILAPMHDGRLGSADAAWAGPVVIDGNLTEALLRDIARSPAFAAARILVAPASPGKATRLACFVGHPGATLYVNLEEAGLIAGRSFRDAAEAARAFVDLGAKRVLVTNGPETAADGAAAGVVSAAPPSVRAARFTGAGDTFMAAHIVATLRGAGRQDALGEALGAAAAFVAGEPVRPMPPR